MSTYELVEPFDTDDGSLDGISADTCFALGVEWAGFRQRFLTGERFSDLCLTANAARFAAMAKRHGRYTEHHFVCEGWSMIYVGDYVV
jgi:hypothetical protein